MENSDADLSQTLDLLKPEPSPGQHNALLFRRQDLTHQLAQIGLYPPLIYQRALCYDALGYADLAAADAFVVCTLCETVRSEEWISDLEPVELSGESWPSDGDLEKNLSLLCDALSVLTNSLFDLGATDDADEKFDELVECYGHVLDWTGEREVLVQKVTARYKIKAQPALHDPKHTGRTSTATSNFQSGSSRREVYPWNNHEPDRNSPQSLSELNRMLEQAAPKLTAKATALPALNEDGTATGEMWHQLGLFAADDLSAGSEILREKSLLTAIRPLDDALCDACGADLETISRESMRQCPGEDCDTTFCSQDCANRAALEYHKPNVHDENEGIDDRDQDEDEPEVESESDYPPARAPFCANTALHELGRTSSTTTPEWDLYFLLLTRTLQMSTTQTTHPLSLPSIKYLWGDFNPQPNPQSRPTTPKKTLPWSLHHNLTLPLQYFETLMHSTPTAKPYSPHWLANFDWWIQTTLFAKFRGVANAQQSTFDGKPEIAAVHPLWCLANHSCAPNVEWSPTGERVFRVRGENEVFGEREGIREGEEIWSHYTDVRLSVKERRERLLEVLGGVCRCSRCLREAELA